jgi:hypothetical protein
LNRSYMSANSANAKPAASINRTIITAATMG